MSSPSNRPLVVPLLALALGLAAAEARAGGSVVLYSNDFETPNVPIEISCGNSLDVRTIDVLYGDPSFVFHQAFTVEAVSIDDAQDLYSDPEGVGGSHAIGMLSAFQDDKLALTFDSQGRAFINVGLDLSSIDVNGCGGPFGVDVPVMQVSLLDSPGGVFSFADAVLDSDTITGEAAPDQWTFQWTRGVVSLDASGSTDGFVSILFDLTQSGYGAFDNLSIVASDTVGVVDSDTDGIPDDEDNCPDTPNPGQEDADDDGIGDVCDLLNDADDDGIADDVDNCPTTPNPGQEDGDEDGIGDACDDVTTCGPPQPGCIGAGKASLAIVEKKEGKEKWKLKLAKLSEQVTVANFGDPVESNTSYRTCLYDAGGVLVTELDTERTGDTCGPRAKPCWKAAGEKGFKYKDPDATASGIRKLGLKAGDAGKGSVQLQAGNKASKGQVALPTGAAAALSGATSARIQLRAREAACFEALLGDVKKADGLQFKAKGGGVAPE